MLKLRKLFVVVTLSSYNYRFLPVVVCNSLRRRALPFFIVSTTGLAFLATAYGFTIGFAGATKLAF
ncbi:MAG: hypothetical protein IPO70_14960 [Bacteroidetes bacterium]|nr:hypothetical protein [Bacteroidota bacterium]